MTALHDEFPAASYARTVTVLFPTSSGTTADHEVVPLAVPDPPVEVLHCTEETPTLSLAIPLKEIVADAVETIEKPGETIVTAGAKVSAPADVPVPVAGTPELPEFPPAATVVPPLPVPAPTGAPLAGAP